MSRRARTSDSQLKLFETVEHPASFEVRESGRARRMSINVHPHGRVEVVVPRRTKAKTVEDFVRSHRAWIEKARLQMTNAAEPPDLSLPESIHLPAVGLSRTVTYRRAAGTGVRLRERGDSLALSGAVHNENHCRERLRRWLKQTAKDRLIPRLEHWSRVTGLEYKKVQVRGQRTRWGSYSGTGTLSVNYSLLFLDPELVDYLFVHELCHIRHMNHSMRYWRFVQSFLPDARRLDRALGEGWKRVPGWVSLT